MDDYDLARRRDLIRLFQRAATPRDEAVTLKDGRTTNVYLDPKSVLVDGRTMKLACSVMAKHISHGRWTPRTTAIGGPTMGADILSHGIVMNFYSLKWFSVRDQPKAHGLGKWIEGANLGDKDRVILTDDIADTGKSLIEAFATVTLAGAEVIAVVPLIDRSDKVGWMFEEVGIPYSPVLTYRDLGIDSL